MPSAGPPILPPHNGFLLLDKAKFAEHLGPGLDLGTAGKVARILLGDSSSAQIARSSCTGTTS